MTTSEEIATILAEHKGSLVGDITIRPLSVDDLFEVAGDFKQIARPLIDGLAKLDAIGKLPLEEVVDALLDLLTPALPAVRRLLQRCMDRPLKDVPLPLAPLLLRRFIEQNFTGPRLKPWADLFGQMARAAAGNRVAGTSGTPASSSPSTDTPAGATTPPTSSSSGAGAASAANAAAPPTN